MRQDEYVLDIVAANGVPFRVVYGKRPYLGGSYSATEVVAFYDRRHVGMTDHGQFVSDYYAESLFEDHSIGYDLNLYGGVDSWVIDYTTMRLVRSWLRHHKAVKL